MNIITLAIKNSTTIFVLLVLILVMGVYCYVVLPRESAPEIVIPYITVTTSYQGVSPEDIEALVSVPIERKLMGLSGVKEITSNSIEGMSNVLIEFEADEDIENALQRVRDRVSLAKSDLPADADDPVVNEVNISEFPIMMMALSGDLPLPELTHIAEDLEDAIETVKGVLDVRVIGGVEREIQIEVDPSRVAAYGVSFADLITIAQVENTNTPAGALDLGEAKYLVRTPGEFTSPEDLNNLIVKRGDTGNVYLRDIATVKDGFKDLDSISRLDGKPSVTLAVSKRSGENIIAIARQVGAIVDAARRRLPPGVEIALTSDESKTVISMVSELENSILSGLVLVVGVVFIFLGFRNAFFVALAIPISMLLTFIGLRLTGVTLNIVVLFSLILALGMLVDNGIVVVENIYRHGHMNKTRFEAARDGALEVAWPIVSSTLTTVAAFVPLLFWPGIMGNFMFYLPATVSTALLASLFVGLIVNPAQLSVFLRIHPEKIRPGRQRHPVLQTYARLLRLALRWRKTTFALAVAALVVIGGQYARSAKMVFMPEIEPTQATVNIDCPEGTGLETSDSYVRKVEAVLEPYRGYLEHIIANVGSQSGDHDLRGGAGGTTTHLSSVTLDFPDLEDCKRPPSAILKELRYPLEQITGATVRIQKMAMGPPTGPAVNIEISGDDFEVLSNLAKNGRERIKDVPGLVDLRDDYNRGKPEVRVVVDRQQAWEHGLNTQFVGLAVKAAINGRTAGEYREGDEEYDVTVRFPKTFRENLENIESMNLVNLGGQPVPFSAVAHLEQGAGLGSIKRIDRKRTVTVIGNAAEGMSSMELLKEVKTVLADFEVPPGYALAYTGEEEEKREAVSFLSKAFIVAVLLIALVLVTQFNSIVQPLIILTSVILSLAGVFLGLLIFHMPFGVIMTGLGCISLAGVVVNNAIVLLDFINKLWARGLPLTEAIVEGSITRFRPVMLTAGTAVLGLVPMAIGVSFDFRQLKWAVGGETSQFWGSMAVAVIFGLTFATVLTLVVVPTLYSMVETLRSRLKGGQRAKAEAEDKAERTVSVPATASVVEKQ